MTSVSIITTQGSRRQKFCATIYDLRLKKVSRQVCSIANNPNLLLIIDRSNGKKLEKKTAEPGFEPETS